MSTQKLNPFSSPPKYIKNTTTVPKLKILTLSYQPPFSPKVTPFSNLFLCFPHNAHTPPSIRNHHRSHHPERGLDYFKKGAVIPEEDDGDGEMTFVVQGSEEYLVPIKLIKDVITDYMCDFPGMIRDRYVSTWRP